MDFQYDDINIVPIQKDHKKCEWNNYIPHTTPTHPNKEVWAEMYDNELQDMYLIIRRNIENKFPRKINWDRPSIFNNLTTVIYHCSSKHIDT